MWLVTRDGFYSVVEQRGGGDLVLVRCRVKEHARALLDTLGTKEKIVDMPTADYRFRVVLPRAQWTRYLAFASQSIDYDSHFKEVVEAAQPEKLKKSMYRVMMRVWTEFAELQPTRPYGGRRK